MKITGVDYENGSVVGVDVEGVDGRMHLIPVVHGHWILEKSYSFDCCGFAEGWFCRCSVCGDLITSNGVDKTGKALATLNNLYCRWCGAKMDEEGEQE